MGGKSFSFQFQGILGREKNNLGKDQQGIKSIWEIESVPLGLLYRLQDRGGELRQGKKAEVRSQKAL